MHRGRRLADAGVLSFPFPFSSRSSRRATFGGVSKLGTTAHAYAELRENNIRAVSMIFQQACRKNDFTTEPYPVKSFFWTFVLIEM